MFTDGVLGWFEGLTYWKWLLAGLTLLGVEMLTGTTYLLWAGFAALLTGVVALGFEADWRIQIFCFAVFAFILIVAGRRVFRPGWTPADQSDV